MQSKPVSRPVLDNAAQLVEMDTVSLMSVSSFGDEEYEEEAECSITPSLTSINSLQLSRWAKISMSVYVSISSVCLNLFHFTVFVMSIICLYFMQ